MLSIDQILDRINVLESCHKDLIEIKLKAQGLGLTQTSCATQMALEETVKELIGFKSMLTVCQ